MKQANPKATIDKHLLGDFIKQQVLSAFLTGAVYAKGETLEQAQDSKSLEAALDMVEEGLIKQLPMLNAFVVLSLQSKGYNATQINEVYQELLA
jgi:hypothetical protein